MVNRLHWSALLALATALSASLSGCDWIDSLVSAIEDDLSAEPAIAAEQPLGFIPAQDFPHRDHTYDGYLAPNDGLAQWQLEKLFFHVAMPQSHEALVGFLGYPDAEQGDYLYWKIEGGSSELAIYYQGSKAINYTVGY